MFDKTRLDRVIAGGKGSESFGTKIKFVARFFGMSAGWGLFVGVALVSVWLMAISPTSRSLLGNEFKARSLPSAQAATWLISCKFSDWPQGQCGDPASPNEFKETLILSGGSSNLTAAAYREIVQKHFMSGRWLHPFAALWLVLIGALSASAAVSVVVFKKLMAAGVDLGKNKRLSGALDLVTGPELSKIVEKSGTASPFEICEVVLPKQTLVKGVVFCGSQGSGKSTALHDLIAQVKSYNSKIGDEK